MASTSIFRLSRKMNPDNKQQVIVRLVISRDNRPVFKSGVWIRANWLKGTTTLHGSKQVNVYEIKIPNRGQFNDQEISEAAKAKAALSDYMTRLERVTDALTEERGKDITSEEIADAVKLSEGLLVDDITLAKLKELRKNPLQAGKKESKTLYQWGEVYLSEKNITEGRKRSFRVLLRSLARYEEYMRKIKRQKGFKLEVDTINQETLKDFYNYLENEIELAERFPVQFAEFFEKYPVECKPKHIRPTIKARGRSIMLERKKQLRAFYNWLNNDKKATTNRPFDGWKFDGVKYGTPFFLYNEERDIVASWDFSHKPDLGVHRDIFVFHCLIGCRFSDLVTLTWRNVVSTPDGMFITYIPAKTKDEHPDPVEVPLTTRARELMFKYKGVDSRGRLFPFMSNQKYNVAIKKILKECEITRIVPVINPTTGAKELRPINEIASSHMARRTFIGNLYSKIKDPNIIGSMSGHAEGSRSFSRYRDIDRTVKRQTVALLEEIENVREESR